MISSYPLPRYIFQNISQCILVQTKFLVKVHFLLMFQMYRIDSRQQEDEQFRQSQTPMKIWIQTCKNLLVYIQSIRSPISIYELIKYTRTPVKPVSHTSWMPKLDQAIPHETIFMIWSSKPVSDRCQSKSQELDYGYWECIMLESLTWTLKKVRDLKLTIQVKKYKIPRAERYCKLCQTSEV